MAAQKDNNWLHALLSDNTVRMHDNQTAVQQNTNHLHALMSDNAARLHNNQTVIQLNTNQLHAIMSENAVRAYELGLTTLLDIVTIGHRQYEGQRTITVCCMVIIAHLVYRGNQFLEVGVTISSGYGGAGQAVASRIRNSGRAILERFGLAQ